MLADYLNIEIGSLITLYPVISNLQPWWRDHVWQAVRNGFNKTIQSRLLAWNISYVVTSHLKHAYFNATAIKTGHYFPLIILMFNLSCEVNWLQHQNTCSSSTLQTKLVKNNPSACTVKSVTMRLAFGGNNRYNLYLLLLEHCHAS